MATAYYPAAAAHLLLRLDEALARATVPDPVAYVESGQYLPAPLPDVRPLLVAGAKDELSQFQNLVPVEMTVELPGWRQAGTWSMTLDFRDFPLDPRAIRDCSVELHLGTVSADDWAGGMHGRRRAGVGGRPGLLRSQLDTVIDGAPNPDTILLVGRVDEFAVKHTASGSSVTLSGRDLRGILLDTPIVPRLFRDLDYRKNIVDLVAEIVGRHPLGKNIRVVGLGFPAAGPPPLPRGNEITRTRRGASGDETRNKPKGDAGEQSYWDLITHYCYQVGAVPTFVGADLFVEPAPSLFRTLVGQAARPFLAARRVGGRELSVRKLVYGRNVEELTFNRKYGGVKVPVIQTVCVDTSSTARGAARLLVAEWPPQDKKAARTTTVGASGHQAQTDVLKIPISGCRSLDRLREIARAVYEEVGRGEMGGSCATTALASLGGDNADPDLLRLRPGDPVQFEVDARALSSRAPLVAELIDHARRSPEEAKRHLVGRGFSQALATVLVETLGGAGGVGTTFSEALNVFRVHTVKYSWAQGAVNVSFDFHNYVEQRFDTEGAIGAVAAPAERVA